MTTLPEIGFLRPKHVADIFGVSKATIYKWIEEGKFPKPLKDGKLSFWTAEDIKAIYEEKKNSLKEKSNN